MKNYRKKTCLAIFLILLFLPIYTARAQDYFEYSIQIRTDASAYLTITQFSSVNAEVDTFDTFQQRVFDLIDSAKSITNREMSADRDSLQINTTISSTSKITEFTFIWENFSIIQGNKILFGDIFQAKDFFGQLYGDGALQLSYPSNFRVQSVVPSPYQRQDTSDTLKWARTQDLVTNKVNVVLVINDQGINNNIKEWQLYVTAFAIVVAAAILSLFVVFRVRKRKIKSFTLNSAAANPITDTEEDKILRIIKSSGGSIRQSKITNQLGFSKAKTSQLLATLEKNGNITRYKNGRDKIVTLKERVKGE